MDVSMVIMFYGRVMQVMRTFTLCCLHLALPRYLTRDTLDHHQE